MSLLIKALEQAARDRDSGSADRSSRTHPSQGPSLEPAPVPRTVKSFDTAAPESASTQHEARGRTMGAVESANARRAVTTNREPSLAEGAPTHASRPAPSASRLAEIDAQQQRARAAAVMQAGAQSGQLMFAYLRARPLTLIVAGAILFAVVFAIYVYLQITQPALFARPPAVHQPESMPGPVSSSTVPPAQPAPAPTPASAAEPIVPTTTSAVAPVQPANAQPTTVADAAVQPMSAPPLAASTVIGNTSGSVETPRASAVATTDLHRDAVKLREPSERRAAPPAPVARTGEAPARERERIAVSATTSQPRLNPMLTQAYALLRAGNLQDARASYSRVIDAEPLNVDALLGLAYIAAQENRSDDAMKLYLRILQLDPRHATAQAALIGLVGRADPLASESRLKQLITREPSAFLHFVLGNLYADQSQWPQAQQAYFQAHRLEPDNPDYAYNLAVGLDHLRQEKLALGFYRRAEQLASAQGRANFSLSHARERIGILASQLE